jgi:hypothetical protein
MTKNKMGGAWGACGASEMRTKFCLEILNGRDNSEDQGVDGRMILKLIMWDRLGGCGLDSVAHDTARRRALVNTVVKCMVP